MFWKDEVMIKVGFSENTDEPRLSHIRKTVMSARIYDPYLEQGNIDLAFVGDDWVSFKSVLEDLSAGANLQQQMLRDGRYVFGFKHPHHSIHHLVAIEKFEVRRGFFGAKHGYWAEISVKEQLEDGGEPKYLFSSSLPDLGTKLLAMFVTKEDVELFSRSEARNALMQT